MIELRGLTKRYGPTLAVDDLSFQAQPGKVTGFLGPNGVGRSTSMRMVLGLDRPTAGQGLVDGRPYQELRAPLRVVGALLDAGAVNPRRSARDHLLALARSNGIARSRVEEVLGLVGLDRVAGRRAGAYSLGDAPTAGDRRRPVGRPRHRAVRRARQRAGPRRHPLGPPARQGPRRRGTDGVRLQPPDERDGGHR